MRLNASGNLGLGVTPSAWGSGRTAIQIGNTNSYFIGKENTALGNNAFNDGTNWKYLTSGVNAGLYAQLSGGNHAWYTAPSGTAGNTISFTQAMTLTASGNLLVGTTSDQSRRVQVSGTLALVDSGLSSIADMSINSSGVLTISPYNGSGSTIVFGTAASGGGVTERARITSGGLFQVTADGANQTFTDSGQIALKNTGSAPYISFHESTGARIGYLQMISSGNANLWLQANQPFVFATNNTERARITSGGFFKASNAGTYVSSTGAYHEIVSNTADIVTWVRNTNASSPYGIYIDYSAADPNGTTNEFLLCYGQSNLRAEIRSNGGLANYQANNVDLSDARTKKDITPAASMWNKIGALEIVTYKYNDQTHDDVNVGVIAQQVESVEPVWVDNDGFGKTPEGEEPLKTVYTKDIYFAAIKALQEAMARIEKLEAEVTALKGA
jgi:hypothetical protein